MSYTEIQKNKIFNKICKRISKGEALRNIINKDDTFSDTVFFDLVDSDKDKNKQYARACEERSNVIFEDMFDIADDTGNDIIILSDGRKVENKAIIARDRLRVDTRKWILSKMNPKKYGDKIALEHESPDGSMSPNKEVDLSGLSDKDLDIYEKLQEKIEHKK